MGRYKEHREPKRRGYDDDNWVSDRGADRGADRRPSYASPAAADGAEPVDSVVKWFNAEKGFGFVSLAGGTDAFLHIRQLESAGHSSVPEGTRIKVRVGKGQKGPEVTEVVEVDLQPAQPGSSQRGAARPSQAAGQTNDALGTVKFYKTDKGFGFVGQDGGGKDVFVHATTLTRAGLNGLSEGQRVRMQVSQGQKGLEAQSIELLD